MKNKGYILMPMVKNIGYVKHEGWELTNCSCCGEECYKRPIPEDFKKQLEDYVYLCTECSLRKR